MYGCHGHLGVAKKQNKDPAYIITCLELGGQLSLIPSLCLVSHQHKTISTLAGIIT